MTGFPGARRRDVAALLAAYEASLGLSLAFQDFDAELAALPGAYVPPDGAFLHALLGDQLAGVVALRGLDRAAGIVEMKRLYVTTSARRHGLGRRLAMAAIEAARGLGYGRVRLDTLPAMREAQALYRKLGFVPIGNYNGNPIEGAVFMELDLGRWP